MTQEQPIVVVTGPYSDDPQLVAFLDGENARLAQLFEEARSITDDKAQQLRWLEITIEAHRAHTVAANAVIDAQHREIQRLNGLLAERSVHVKLHHDVSQSPTEKIVERDDNDNIARIIEQPLQ